MTDSDIQKFGEVQYLKGRIDELHKAIPNITNLHRQRVLDVRLEKYYNKLKSVDEMAYHLYIVERTNARFSKEKSKKQIKELLVEIEPHITDKKLAEKITNQINKYG